MIATVLRQPRHSNGSGAALAHALHIAHASPEHTRRCRDSRYIINWGVSSFPRRWQQRAIRFSNDPNAVSLCVDKGSTLSVLRDANVPCLEACEPDFDGGVENNPRTWLEADGKIVVRHVPNGHSGAGIQIVRRGEQIPNAPLYTRYFKKQREYRVHVAFGRVILMQEKKRSETFDENNPNHLLVRTNGNGWCFCINDLHCDAGNYRQHIETLALNAARAVEIGHGAVDILVAENKRDGTLKQAVVCEINSAPALKNPSTLNAYVQCFSRVLSEAGVSNPA